MEPEPSFFAWRRRRPNLVGAGDLGLPEPPNKVAAPQHCKEIKKKGQTAEGIFKIKVKILWIILQTRLATGDGVAPFGEMNSALEKR